MRLDKEQQAVKRVCRMAVAVLLMQLATASADPFVPGAWMQRAAEQQATDAGNQVVDHFRSVEVIGMNELGAMRGGFEIAGLNIDVGAVVRTIIDGNLALESHISLASANEIAAAISSDTRATVNAAPAADSVTIQSSNSAANPLANMPSVVINDAKGLTQVIHDVTRNRIVSAIVNQADLRDIRQEIDIDITVSNFREFQRAAANQRVSRSLSRAGR